MKSLTNSLDELFESVFNATHLREDTPRAYAKSLHDKVLSKAVKAHLNNHNINYVEFNRTRAPLDHVIVDENGNKVNGASDFADLVVNAYHALFPKESVEDSLLRKAAKDYFNNK